MLYAIKTLLLSGTLLTQSGTPLQDGVAVVLGHESVKTAQDENYNKQDENYNKAVELTLQSSYAGFKEDYDRATKLLREACGLGYGRACWYYAFETDDEGDLNHAKDVLSKSCFEGETSRNGESCTFLGILAWHNVNKYGFLGIAQTERELYERACRLNDGWGCYRLTHDFLANEDVEQAKKVGQRALDILISSCKNGNATGCYLAGNIYDENMISGWLKDSESKAQHYYKLGCKLGNGDSCYAEEK